MNAVFDDDLLTIAEAAQILKVSEVTISRWIKQGRLPAYHAGPRVLRIRRADLALALEPVQLTDGAGEVRPANRHAPAALAGAIRPLSDEEIERIHDWLEKARELRQRILAENGGRVLPSSAELIREMRDERSAKL